MIDRITRFEQAARERELSDKEWRILIRDHRWAVGQLARPALPQSLRGRLNAAVLRVHTRLHGSARAPTSERLRRGLGSLARPFVLYWLVFLAASCLAAAAVAAEPTVVYALVPRALLGQIAENAWGVRSGAGADAGMTVFYSVNNSRACLLALGLGVLGGIPGLLIIAYNGALLGAVAGHALHRGVLMNLAGWLGPHGVPELTAMMLSGAIGWSLAEAWIRPGKARRRDALARKAHDLTPWIGAAVVLVLLAAPLEGFIAPLPLPLAIDGAIASGWIALLAFLVYRVRHSRGRREGA